MGTFDPNQSSRNFQQSALASHQKFNHDFRAHNRQYQERAQRLAGSGSHRRPSGSAEYPGDEAGEGPRRGRSTLLLSVLLLGVAGVAIAAQGDEPPPAPSVAFPATAASTAVEGTVLPGTAWNVRGGPGMDFPPFAVVEPGQVVRVTCLQHGWALLESPNPGAYVWAEGLSLTATPAPC